MDIGALRQDDYQVWVPFQDAEVLVRYVSLDGLRNIAKKATRITWDRRHRKVEELDPGESNRLLGREAVRGWKGITMEGEEYPYTPENCDFLMQRWAEFSRFVNDVCVDLQGLMDAEREEKVKNSALTSGQD
jgi:hypothetical protein